VSLILPHIHIPSVVDREARSALRPGYDFCHLTDNHRMFNKDIVDIGLEVAARFYLRVFFKLWQIA
jgi:hypothetical protein